MAMLSLICGAATYSYGDVNLLTAAETVLQSYPLVHIIFKAPWAADYMQLAMTKQGQVLGKWSQDSSCMHDACLYNYMVTMVYGV